AGVHPDFATAQAAMTGLKDVVFRPQAAGQTVYEEIYGLYRKLHDAFGGVTASADLGSIMKDLLALKSRQSR
ncbi:MAG TPA: ribulokinase, partial [Luteolibacter sp.]